MQRRESSETREEELIRIAKSERDRTAVLRHLKEIVGGDAFRGSPRSAQFLTFIVEQAIAGRFDSLKERVIGIEIFGRAPSYDTGEDAIVRVTATDVRKRLLQHYGQYGVHGAFRIGLPSGSYLPAVTRERVDKEECPSSDEDGHGSIREIRGLAAPAMNSEGREVAVERLRPGSNSRWPHRAWVAAGIGVLVLNLALWALYWSHAQHKEAPVPAAPWQAIFASSHAIHLITSDPGIVTVQEIAGHEISVSDYANRKYIPESSKMTADEIRICRRLLWGDDSAAAVDAPIAARIAELAQRGARQIDVKAARSIPLSFLKSDDHYIFLGSPRSNPWVALFDDQLDFRFVFDEVSRQELILNAHPAAGEPARYVPTAAGWATGQSYALIAFLQNPDQNGQVVLLAGANGEGTEAAGRLATDTPRFIAALRRCGIGSSGPVRHFEMLLHLNTMAGAPNNVDVTACHLLAP